ncbi:hypothetical protein DRP04_03720 [Archaeoglobales archaeon]|nr:MAG: hypothetical protein DRP04_03720 [Archaeoglobales archaeon]
MSATTAENIKEDFKNLSIEEALELIDPTILGEGKLSRDLYEFVYIRNPLLILEFCFKEAWRRLKNKKVSGERLFTGKIVLKAFLSALAIFRYLQEPRFKNFITRREEIQIELASLSAAAIEPALTLFEGAASKMLKGVVEGHPTQKKVISVPVLTKPLGLLSEIADACELPKSHLLQYALLKLFSEADFLSEGLKIKCEEIAKEYEEVFDSIASELAILYEKLQAGEFNLHEQIKKVIKENGGSISEVELFNKLADKFKANYIMEAIVELENEGSIRRENGTIILQGGVFE